MADFRFDRRTLLKSLSMYAAGGASGLGTMLAANRGFAQEKKPKFLIVLAGAGGASIIDSFLAIRASESGNASTINTFGDSEVLGVDNSPLRAVDMARSGAGDIPIPFTANQSRFVNQNKDDILVATVTGTSVNHAVAQRRSITGNEAWSGRTLQEAVALEYGANFPLPNVNMSAGGYIEHGTDKSLPSHVFNEPVADPTVFPSAMHGARGLQQPASTAAIARARQLRDEKLDPESTFYRTFRNSDRLKLWQSQRGGPSRALEGADLITKLMFLPDSTNIPLSAYGLQESPDGQKVRTKFPNFLTDSLDAQAALAFLLIKNRVSVTVTIAPSFAVLIDTNRFPPTITNPPLAFDFSHNAHRSAQALMWSRLFRVAGGLIDLLKAEEFDATTGESFWDRSMIYIATEFGRQKRRPANASDFGTSHHLNNGVAIISPMVGGNRVLGGVDPDTGLTYGFDPISGAPDRGSTMAERHIFSGILGALDVNTSGSGLPPVPTFRG